MENAFGLTMLPKQWPPTPPRPQSKSGDWFSSLQCFKVDGHTQSLSNLINCLEDSPKPEELKSSWSGGRARQGHPHGFPLPPQPLRHRNPTSAKGKQRPFNKYQILTNKNHPFVLHSLWIYAKKRKPREAARGDFDKAGSKMAF